MALRPAHGLVPLAAAGVLALAIITLVPTTSAAGGPAGPCAPAGPDSRFTPGAPGVGDSYFPLEGNGGYDVRHYDITLSYDPPTKRLDGTAVITAQATQNLSRFDLDLQQLDVGSVSVDGRPATFRRSGQELVITPRCGLPGGRTFAVTVTYGGVPRPIVGSPVVFGQPYGFVATADGAFVGDEPNAASTWFPSSDHPSDKAAFTFRVTVPGDLQVMSNGRLLSQRRRGDRATFVWDEQAPMATYLATVDIGKWIIKSGRTAGGVPMIVAVDPKLAGRDPERPDPVAFFWNTTEEATDLWARLYGPYPFDSTGAIADLAVYGGKTIGFSLETQTRPLYSDVRDTTTIAHELAHQWFGDAVSVARWRDIWLNESFATFSQFYWIGEHAGRSPHDQAMLIYNGHPADDPWWNVKISDPRHDTMLHDRVYHGGAMVLQFLREKIGDEKFFALVRDWVARHRYGNATTEQFTALAAKVSGQDLGPFFRTWIYSTGRPALSDHLP
jgi:aminopeptidase N